MNNTLARCPLGLVMIDSEEKAIEVLAQRMKNKKGETHYFECDLGGHWHLARRRRYGSRAKV